MLWGSLEEIPRADSQSAKSGKSSQQQAKEESKPGSSLSRAVLRVGTQVCTAPSLTDAISVIIQSSHDRDEYCVTEHLSSRLTDPEKSLNPGHFLVIDVMTSGLCLNTDALVVLLSWLSRPARGLHSHNPYSSLDTRHNLPPQRSQKNSTSSFPFNELLSSSRTFSSHWEGVKRHRGHRLLLSRHSFVSMH